MSYAKILEEIKDELKKQSGDDGYSQYTAGTYSISSRKIVIVANAVISSLEINGVHTNLVNASYGQPYNISGLTLVAGLSGPIYTSGTDRFTKVTVASGTIGVFHKDIS